MYSFRALVRRILGVSLPSETVASEVEALKEQVNQLRGALSQAQITALISDVRYELAEDAVLDAIFVLVNGIGLSGVTVDGEGEYDEDDYEDEIE